MKNWKYIDKVETGNASPVYKGQYIDVYDSGVVLIKEGWAFGERIRESDFRRWIDGQIAAKQKTLDECKKMKREFESQM